MFSRCPCETVTIYRHDYKYPPRSTKNYRCDRFLCPKTKPELVNKKEPKPILIFGLKEYKHFEQLLSFCKTTICKLFHHCPDVNVCQLENWLRELEKIVGQAFNIPLENTTLKKIPRIAKTWDPTTCDVHDRDYRFYFSRFEALLRFKSVLYARARKWEQEQEEKAQQEREEAPPVLTIKTGFTTYFAEICRPALDLAKTKVLVDSPIDRYTERRP